MLGWDVHLDAPLIMTPWVLRPDTCNALKAKLKKEKKWSIPSLSMKLM